MQKPGKSTRFARTICIGLIALSNMWAGFSACAPGAYSGSGGPGGSNGSGNSPDAAGNASPYGTHQYTGASARALLASDSFQSLIVEIQAVRGYQPTQQAINQLQGFLQARLNKPGGIQIYVDAPIDPPGKASYTIDDVRAIEDQHRLYFPSGNLITAYYLFLDGASASDTPSFQIFGQAHRNTSMALYEKTILANSGAIGQPSVAVLESTVMLHEFGHLLGLVGTGTTAQSQHQDTPNGAHCNNKNCLMYYAVDTSNILANLLGGNIPSLDANCLQDLQASGGK